MEAAGEESPKENTTNVLPPNNNITPEETPAIPPAQDTLKKSKREERLKVDKNVEQFMKSLNTIPTVDEKLSVVCKKFTQISDENRKLHFFIKQTDKRFALIEKEKDQLQLEYNKVVLVKSKLENLCRELQKQNKAVKEESLLRIREEEERRKETQAKFQNTLSEITTLLQQNNEKNTKLRDDNISLTERFKSVVQQYQLREQQVDKMAKQMSLESQLSDAKLQKAALEHQAEKERILAEMEQLKVTLAQYRTKILELQGTETALKGQLTVYTDKYDEFQNALVKSNQMFGGFKEQMEKMSKKIQKLEKESLMWKKRWETSQAALLDMCGERQASEERCGATSRHLNQMQSLCRTLQAERTLLLNTLKENNIERPPVPVLPPAPPIPSPQPSKLASNARVDAMAANCAQLRQSLAHIQSQLTTLTNNNATAKEEAAKVEKPKKSKSKKNKAEKLAQKQVAEKAEMKEQESDDSNTKSNSEETQPTTSDVPDLLPVEMDRNESPEDKIDSNTMNCLIQAINMANINLCDLEIVNDDNISKDAVIEEIIDDVGILNDSVTNRLAIDESNNVKSKGETSIAEPVQETNIAKSVGETSIAEPVVETNVVESTEETNIVEPIGETNVTKPVGESIIVKPVGEINSVEPLGVPNIVELAEETNISKPIEKTNIVEPNIKETETVSDPKLNQVKVESILNQSPRVNGDETAKDEVNMPVTNKSNDNLPVVSEATEVSEVLSSKQETEAKEAVVLQENLEVVTQAIKIQPVCNES